MSPACFHSSAPGASTGVSLDTGSARYPLKLLCHGGLRQWGDHSSSRRFRMRRMVYGSASGSA
jgi:hypothetical protein